MRFQVPKRMTLLGQVQIVNTYSAITPVGGGTARFVDYAGFRQFASILNRYGSNQIQTLDWIILHLLHKLYKTTTKQDAENVLVGGNLSVIERETAGAAAQTFITDLPFWWTHHPSLFVNADALSHQLEIIATMCTAAELTQATSGSTPTVTLTASNLKCRMIHVEDEERDELVEKTLMGAGVVMAVRDFASQLDNVLASGSTAYNIKLTNLKDPIVELMFVVRDYTSKTTPSTITNLPYNFNRLGTNGSGSWELKAAGLQVIDLITDLENLYYFNPRDHSGDAGIAIYGHRSALDVEDWMNSTGHDNMGGLTQPTLYLNFQTAPASQQIVDVYCVTLNTTQASKGDLMKNFI